MSNLLAEVTIPNWTVCTGDGIQLAELLGVWNEIRLRV